MKNLKKIGTLQVFSAREKVAARLGVGFEKLDRAVFDPEKAYDKLGAVGAKWIRLQSGWQRTEREKGVYDFAWLDDIVNNLIARGMTPWICLCYGNELYNEEAKQYFGAVGVPPIFTEEQRTGWANYVTATVGHFKGRVTHYEIWNEPDNNFSWKHGPNTREVGEFNIATAKAIRAGDENAFIIGGTISRDLAFLRGILDTGMGNYVDAITYHAYTLTEAERMNRYRTACCICRQYNPDLIVIQGEAGTQSSDEGHGALWHGWWTPEKQAKFLLRGLVCDLAAPMPFASWFSCLDMIEALNGTVGDKASYLDYGYFGLLAADFDENGFSTGEYSPKPAYFAMQNLCALLGNATPDDTEAAVRPALWDRSWVPCDLDAEGLLQRGFRLENGARALAYWHPAPVLTGAFDGVTTLVASLRDHPAVHLVDPMDGAVYEIGEGCLSRDACGNMTLKHLKVRDYPLFLVFGELPPIK